MKKNNKEMTTLYTRDKRFNRIAGCIMLLPVLYFVKACVSEIIGFANGIFNFAYDLESLQLDAMLPLSIVLSIALMLLKSLLYEGESTKYAELALPVSSRTRVLYDIRFGGGLLILVNLIYAVLIALIEIFEMIVYAREVVQTGEYGENAEYIRILTTDSLKEFFGDYLAELIIALSAVYLIYLLFVLGKYVSAKIGWAFAFMLCAYLALAAIEQVFGSVWFMLFVGQIGWNVYRALITIVTFALIFGCILLAQKAAAARDEARRGAYYFGAARWLVCIVTAGAAIFGAMALIADFGSIAKLIFTVLAVLLSGAVLCGMLYVTAAKHALNC